MIRNKEWTLTSIITDILNKGPVTRRDLYSTLRKYKGFRRQSVYSVISNLRKYKAITIRYDIYTGEPTYKLSPKTDTRIRTIDERVHRLRTAKVVHLRSVA